ncbi:MAG: ATP cone domain-containing protein, partial [Bacteroidales bacterium]
MKSVIKRNGEKDLFDVEKLRKSLRRAGASESEIERVVEYISEQMTDGMSTHVLYKLAYAQLRQKSAKAAGRYRLKKAILDLGPTGFPFELLVGELLKDKGFNVQVGIIARGKCVDHELDVVAYKPGLRVMVECKFHNDIRRKSDVKVSLYIQSRFQDMKSAWEKEPGFENLNYEGWIVTNTRFTEDALQYGNCSGLKLVSWDYPVGESLRDMIDKAGFHPITALHSITNAEKNYLLENEIVLCRTLMKNSDILRKLGKSEK